MKPQYITVIGGTPKVIAVDSNIGEPHISVRTTATTTEYTIESPQDAVAKNSYVTAVGPAPTWIAAPAAVDGVIQFDFPIAGLRFTNATDTVATVLQQGI